MPDLATILGVQIAQKLQEIQNAMPPPQAAGYLAPRKGGQAASQTRSYEQVPPAKGPTPTPRASKSYLGVRGRNIGDGGPGRDRELGRDELDRTPLTEGNKFFMRPSDAGTSIPPTGSDPVVTPEQPLIVKKGGRSYLMMQVPAVNEQGKVVDMVGPKGAPMIFQQTTPADAVQPIPNAPAKPIEFRDAKHRGVFMRHMKAMYDQMMQQIQNQYGIPV